MVGSGVLAATSEPVLVAERARYEAQKALIQATAPDAQGAVQAWEAAQQAYAASLAKVMAKAETAAKAGMRGSERLHVLEAACRYLDCSAAEVTLSNITSMPSPVSLAILPP